MNKLRSALRGFTIIELAIVVVVIGVLASMAVIGFTKARNRAIATTMRNDARQIAMALRKIELENPSIPANTPLVLSVNSAGLITHGPLVIPDGTLPANAIQGYVNQISKGYTGPISCVLGANSAPTAFTMAHPLVAPASVAENSIINNITTLGVAVAFDDNGAPL